jgi:DNA repair protein RadC
MTMTAVPLAERPRERLWQHGVRSLSDRELLAVMVGSGTSSTPVLDLSAAMLERFGDLSGVAGAAIDELTTMSGVGTARAAALAAAFELGRRVAAPVVRGVIGEPIDIALLARRELLSLSGERVLLFVCDNGMRLRRTVVLSDGGSDTSVLDVRDALHAVLRNNGGAFAVAHNHPSGIAEPSDRDRAATARLARAADVVGLHFLGHVVVTASAWCSIDHSGRATRSELFAGEHAVRDQTEHAVAQ